MNNKNTEKLDDSTEKDDSPYAELLETVIDNYVIEKVLGTGGQAVVFLAHGRAVPNNQYALKVFGLLGQPSSKLNEGLKEASSQARVDHPSVVKVNEPGMAEVQLGEDKHQILFIPMQYAPLGSCDDGPPFVDRDLEIDDFKTIIGLLDGLNTINNNEIIHRDIKPANILKFQERHAAHLVTVLRITDFGIAKVLSAIGSGEDGASGVTPAYMSPEQLDGQPTNKGDVYSMGATLYFMLTGENPISDPEDIYDVFAWQLAHRESPRPNPIDFNPRCPTRLALLVMQMMSVNPSDRPTLDECISILNGHIEMIEAKALGFKMPEPLQSQVVSDSCSIRYVPDFSGIFDPTVHLLCGTRLFALRLKMTRPIFIQYRLLVEHMVKSFSDCFCMYETFGTYDIHIFIWSDKERINKLEASLEAQFTSGVEVAAAKQIVHLHSDNSRILNANINVVGALAVQDLIHLEGVEPNWYLCGNYPTKIPVHSVRAFIYINAVEPNHRERHWMQVAIYESVLKKMKEMAKIQDKVSENDEGGTSFSEIRKRFPRLSLIELEEEPEKPQQPIVIVNYVSRDYKHLHEIMTAITELGDSAVKTATFLETGRIIIQSDKILF